MSGCCCVSLCQCVRFLGWPPGPVLPSSSLAARFHISVWQSVIDAGSCWIGCSTGFDQDGQTKGANARAATAGAAVSATPCRLCLVALSSAIRVAPLWPPQPQHVSGVLMRVTDAITPGGMPAESIAPSQQLLHPPAPSQMPPPSPSLHPSNAHLPSIEDGSVEPQLHAVEDNSPRSPSPSRMGGSPIPTHLLSGTLSNRSREQS
jgi:hypothetical protein